MAGYLSFIPSRRAFPMESREKLSRIAPKHNKFQQLLPSKD